MARQTRSQRRARRAAQQQSQVQGGGSGIAQRARARQAQMRPSQQPQRSQTGAQRTRGGARSFVAESWGELKKVEWPGQSQVIQATIVVLIACAVVGTYLYVFDQIWKPTVKWIIGS